MFSLYNDDNVGLVNIYVYTSLQQIHIHAYQYRDMHTFIHVYHYIYMNTQ